MSIIPVEEHDRGETLGHPQRVGQIRLAWSNHDPIHTAGQECRDGAGLKHRVFVRGNCQQHMRTPAAQTFQACHYTRKKWVGQIGNN